MVCDFVVLIGVSQVKVEDNKLMTSYVTAALHRDFPECLIRRENHARIGRI